MSEKTFKIKAPMGNIMLPKETMTESEVRYYASQIASTKTFKEKAAKDPIAEVVGYLNQAGFSVTEVK